jgi:hypothetical protein
VKDAVRRAARLLLVPTIVLLVVAVLASGRLEQAVRVYALVVCAVVLGLALQALRESFPDADRLRPTRGDGDRPAERPRSLAQLEGEVALGAGDAASFHYRLRPRLRLIAAGLLEDRRNVSLDREPEKARRLLGDETWELVRPDRPDPADRHAPGLASSALERVVVSLERL